MLAVILSGAIGVYQHTYHIHLGVLDDLRTIVLARISVLVFVGVATLSSGRRDHTRNAIMNTRRVYPSTQTRAATTHIA